MSTSGAVCPARCADVVLSVISDPAAPSAVAGGGTLRPLAAAGASPEATRERTVRLGLIAAPGVATEVARELARDLPAALNDAVSRDVVWAIPTVTDPLATDVSTGGIEMIDMARARMLEEGWDLAVCLTDLPLRIGRRPVVADASATHGVGLVCLPALGAMQLRRRARDAIARVVFGLLGESPELDPADSSSRGARIRRRLVEIAVPVREIVPDDEDVDLRFVTAVVRGNLRLLLGMLRANRPWRLIVRLTRALVATMAAVALVLITSDVWRLADGLDWPRLLVIAVGSLAVIVITLIAAHGLWERPVRGQAREPVVLFNLATALTVAVGVASLYAALFVVTLASTALVVDAGVLSRALGHDVGLGDYVRIAWLASSIATVGGALGAGLESDESVREAAYRYRPERHDE